MARRDRITIYCFILFSCFICEESWRLGLGNFHQPGPGFLPFGAGLIIIAMGILQLAGARRKAVPAREPFLNVERIWKFIAVVAICFGYGLLLFYLGFVLTTGLFVLIALKAIEPQRWGKAAFISAATAFAAYLLFDYWLQIQMPKGTWVYPVYNSLREILWK